MTPNTLYHYTCADAEPSIRRTGELRPNRHPLLRCSVVWLTDLPWPDRWRLGLTASYLGCDRLAFRATVPYASSVEPWSAFAERVGVLAPLREILEDGALPERWYVSTLPVPITAIAPTGRTSKAGSR